jgi:hypothetical protein
VILVAHLVLIFMLFFKQTIDENEIKVDKTQIVNKDDKKKSEQSKSNLSNAK